MERKPNTVKLSTKYTEVLNTNHNNKRSENITYNESKIKKIQRRHSSCSKSSVDSNTSMISKSFEKKRSKRSEDLEVLFFFIISEIIYKF